MEAEQAAALSHSYEGKPNTKFIVEKAQKELNCHKFHKIKQRRSIGFITFIKILKIRIRRKEERKKLFSPPSLFYYLLIISSPSWLSLPKPLTVPLLQLRLSTQPQSLLLYHPHSQLYPCYHPFSLASFPIQYLLQLQRI